LPGKFGKNIETQALLLYFLQRVKAQGISSPGRHFVAVTEQGSYLAEMAQTYQFRGLSLDPPGIKGRYSALIHFGLFLSAFYRVDPASVLSAAIAMRDLCWPLTSPEANPALHLAAFLAAAAVDGTDRFLLFNTPSLEGLPYRVGPGCQCQHVQGRTRAHPDAGTYSRPPGDLPPALRGGNIFDAR
jgi:transaldolase / glucose-6-phosphate isomerase